MSEPKQTLWQKWMAFSMKGAGILLMILLFLSYFTIVLPVAIIFRFASDPLRLRLRAAAPGSFFLARKTRTETRESASRPY